MRALNKVILTAGLVLALSGHAQANEGVALPQHDWSHTGVFGTIDKAAAQRGFQVFKEVCSACHSARLIRIRELKGIGFSDADLKAIAAGYQVADGPNDQGEMFQRPGLPSDVFPKPFPNDNAARAANNGALPPDLSVIAKARKGGEDYIAALLTGYTEAPADFKLNEGMSYNKYFTGHQIAMPQVVNDDGVTYSDGTKATKDQIAYDVATFLTFVAEPSMDQRKQTGMKVILFLIVLSGLLYATKRHLWRNVEH
ncbi:MAG: cytochrome c1 [Azospirillum sp.]|nr:cytochrome c1 [Azospirillum sp.]